MYDRFTSLPGNCGPCPRAPAARSWAPPDRRSPGSLPTLRRTRSASRPAQPISSALPPASKQIELALGAGDVEEWGLPSCRSSRSAGSALPAPPGMATQPHQFFPPIARASGRSCASTHPGKRWPSGCPLEHVDAIVAHWASAAVRIQPVAIMTTGTFNRSASSATDGDAAATPRETQVRIPTRARMRAMRPASPADQRGSARVCPSSAAGPRPSRSAVSHPRWLS